MKIQMTLELKCTSHPGFNLEMQSKSSCGALHTRATRLPFSLRGSTEDEMIEPFSNPVQVLDYVDLRIDNGRLCRICNNPVSGYRRSSVRNTCQLGTQGTGDVEVKKE